MAHERKCREVLEQYGGELQRLRTSHRRVCVGMSTLLCAILVGWAAQGRPEVPDTIEAHRFVLLDSKGAISAMWSAREPDEHRAGSASLVFNSDDGMAVMLDAGDGHPSLIMNGGGDFVSEGRLGHVILGTSDKRGPSLELWSQVGPKAASQGGKTTLQTPWADNPKSIDITRGETSVWFAPPQ
jgi:hypothetical protein